MNDRGLFGDMSYRRSDSWNEFMGRTGGKTGMSRTKVDPEQWFESD